MLEVADIFRAHGPSWRHEQRGHLSVGQLKVMSAIESCRSAALGGHALRCSACAQPQIAYNSCRNRHCPKCQSSAAQRWLDARQADLLPVDYYHVVFTLPAPLSAIAYTNKELVYGLLFDLAAETLRTIAADPKHLGARIGVTLVLHTWGSALTHHPHVHGIVPGGGLALDAERWVPCRPGFFLPVRVLSRLFRRRFLEELTAAHGRGQLHFFGEHADLADPAAFADWLAPLRQCEWVVYAKRPFAGPAAVLAYLSRYTHRVAISNRRLLALDERGVTFRWKDYRAEGRTRHKTMSLSAPSSCAASCCTCCRAASTASATTGCSPTPAARATSPPHARSCTNQPRPLRSTRARRPPARVTRSPRSVADTAAHPCSSSRPSPASRTSADHRSWRRARERTSFANRHLHRRRCIHPCRREHPWPRAEQRTSMTRYDAT